MHQVFLTRGMHSSLVVRLRDGCVDLAGFEALPVPADRLDEVDTGGRVRSVMLTVRGRTEEGYDFLVRSGS